MAESPRPILLTVAVRAAVAAQETHEQEKLEALSAGIKQRALDRTGQAVQLIFVSRSTIDPAYLQLLSFLHDPVAAFQVRGLNRPSLAMGGISYILEQAFPWKREFYDRLAADLNQAGFVDLALHVMMSGRGYGTVGRPTDSFDGFAGIRYGRGRPSKGPALFRQGGQLGGQPCVNSYAHR